MAPRHLRFVVAAALSLTLLSPLISPSVAAAVQPLVVIDPGHGGRYSNANANGLKEKNVNLAIALELRTQLQARGYRVAMTRTTDRALTLKDIGTWNWLSAQNRWAYARDGHAGLYGGIPKDDLQARVDYANRLGADLFISIHNNGSASRAARGTETYAARRDPLGGKLAARVHQRIVARTGLYSRGVGSSDFYVCRWSNMPAILVEGAFISNYSDAAKLKSSSFRRRMAIGIAEGVDGWFASAPFSATVSEVSASSASNLAADLSARSTAPTPTTVVVCRSDRWADAPAAPALAKKLAAPILWTNASGTNTATAEELSRISPDSLVLVGLDESFPETMTAELTAEAGIAAESVQMLSAPGRAELSAAIAESITALAATPPTQVIIVDEADKASALAVAAAAASRGIPVLLSRSGELTAPAQAYLDQRPGIRTTLLVGASASLPSSLADGRQIVRYTGADVASRANSVNGRFYPGTARGSLSAIVADINDGAGYLTVARYSADTARPVVPVMGGALPVYSRLYLTNRRPQIGRFQIVDSRNTVPRRMGHMLKKADYE